MIWKESGETEKKLICQKYKKWHRKITEKQKWVIRERLRKEVLSLWLLQFDKAEKLLIASLFFTKTVENRPILS